VQGRPNTPIPVSDFFWAAGAVVTVSFVLLVWGWSRPRFRIVSWWALPDRLSRSIMGPLRTAGRVIALGALVFVLGAAALGSSRIGANIAPISVFVLFWIGLVPVSLLLGNVWREVNPWATLARAIGLERLPKRVPPAWLGLWPAVLALVGFGWFELVYPTQSSPRLIAVLILLYSAMTLAGMARYGVERWLDQGELFSVLSGLLAHLSPVEVRGSAPTRRLGLRRR